MDNSRLSKQAQNTLKRLKEKLLVSPYNKKTLEFIISDYERLKEENEKLKDSLYLQGLRQKHG